MKPSPPPRDNHIERIAARWVMRRDAGLGPAERAEFLEWLAADPRHASALARKESAWTALDRPQRHGQAGEVLGRLARRAGRRRRRQFLLASTAAVLIAITGSHILDFTRTPEATAGRVVVLRPETRRLPDGSIVELQPGARLDDEYTSEIRRVRLIAGTAFFAVARDAARPFVVRAGDVDFRALGTQFAVELGLARVDVIVTEGRVAVETSTAITRGALPGGPPSGTLPGAAMAAPAAVVQLATVGSGSRLAVDDAALSAAAPLQPLGVSAAEIDERLAWRAPRLEFSELPLEEAVALFNRYNSVPFRIPDASLGRLRISGIVRADNPDGFLRMLESSFEVRGHREADAIVIRRSRR